MQTETTAESARTILVPLANPQTANALLRLALALSDSDGGRVIAVFVATGDTEQDHRTNRRVEVVLQ